MRPRAAACCQPPIRPYRTDSDTACQTRRHGRICAVEYTVRYGDGWQQGRGRRTHPRITATIPSLRMLVKAGQGIGLLPSYHSGGAVHACR